MHFCITFLYFFAYIKVHVSIFLFLCRDFKILHFYSIRNFNFSYILQYSLGEYMSAFKQDPDNPLIALMLGLTFVHMACQKFSARKHSLVVQVKQLSFKFHSRKPFNYWCLDFRGKTSKYKIYENKAINHWS